MYRNQDDPVDEPGWDKTERARTQAWSRPRDGGLKQEGLPHRASFLEGWGLRSTSLFLKHLHKQLAYTLYLKALIP